jgi:hypothetical protein
MPAKYHPDTSWAKKTNVACRRIVHTPLAAYNEVPGIHGRFCSQLTPPSFIKNLSDNLTRGITHCVRSTAGHARILSLTTEYRRGCPLTGVRSLVNQSKLEVSTTGILDALYDLF